jgi:hypothetical protein
VSSGGLDVSAADSIVLLSNATKTSQILTSIPEAFTGDFIIQRYISTRNANYTNITTPISNGTFNDLDDDLAISGAGGLNGNATVNGGGIFYSLKSFNPFNDKHDTISDINSVMNPGAGYEVYLYNSLSTFNSNTIDFIGTPNNGDIEVKYTSQVNTGWNLIGNPYHSFIDWSIVTTGGISNNYYIFNTDLGSYSLMNTSDPIAPTQAFWVYQPNGGGFYPTFTEASKVNSTSPTFFRKKTTNDYFSLKVKNLSNFFSNELNINFNLLSSKGMDNFDIPNLPTPIKGAPSITAKSNNSDKDLILTSLNHLDNFQLIPISIDAGISGTYELKAENIDALYKNYNCVFLKDKSTNKAIDLLVEETFNFEAKKGKTDRFELILSNNFEQCHTLIDDNSLTQNLDKRLKLRSSNNEWFLDYTLNNESSNIQIHIFSMNGQEVTVPIEFSVSESGSRHLQNLNNLKGVYLIKVISNNQIINKTVKL